jgi:plasmid stabilization system protein ParE
VKIRVLGAASRDIVDGYRFYEAQAEGIGEYFLDSIFSDIDSLALTAGVHEVHFGSYHRMLSRRFPFAVYYRIEDDVAVVYAVLDCRKQPAWARTRLER